MKSLLIWLFFAFASLAAAGPKPGAVTFEWDDPNNVGVTVYGFWERKFLPPTTPGGPPVIEDTLLTPVAATTPGVGPHTYTLNSIESGTHTYFVTAMSPEGIHSPESNTVTVNMLRPPVGNRVKITLQSSSKPGDGEWEEVAIFEDMAIDRRKFWQVLIAKE